MVNQLSVRLRTGRRGPTKPADALTRAAWDALYQIASSCKAPEAAEQDLQHRISTFLGLGPLPADYTEMHKKLAEWFEGDVNCFAALNEFCVALKAGVQEGFMTDENAPVFLQGEGVRRGHSGEALNGVSAKMFGEGGLLQ